MEKFLIKGRVAVITGGAGMLGAMHAEAIAEAGGIPVLADLKGESAERVAREIESKYSVPALGMAVDITRKDEIETLRNVVLDKLGSVDILINNAANDPKVGKGDEEKALTRFENLPLEMWDQDVKVGLTGAFLCSQALGSQMTKQGRGVIVNISSDLGLIAPDQRLYSKPGLPDHQQPVKPVTYSVIKTGLIGLTRYLATYWADRGVRANTLCPGGVEAGQPDDFKQELASRIPMSRMANRDEYKSAIQFLVSDASSYMTGSTVTIDGGRTCW